MKKTLLLATFIFHKRLEWFLNYLEVNFKITKEKVFIYKNLDDNTKLIITFRVDINNGEHLNIKTLFPNAILIHKNGNAIYTINALNKMIDKMVGDLTINNSEIKIDWSEYQNKMILTNRGELTFLNISRVFN